MIINSAEQLERMQADGQIAPDDADEIRTFMEFMREAPSSADRNTPAGRKALREAYAKYYPEDYARTVAEHQAKTEPTS